MTPGSTSSPSTHRPLGSQGRRRFWIAAFTFASVLFPLSCSTSTTSSYAVTCGSRHIDIASAKKISTSWTMEQIVRLLGSPERNVGSRHVVNEWTCTDGTVIHATSAGDYGDPVAAVEFTK